MSQSEKAQQVFSSNAERRREAMFETYRELIELGESPLGACARMGVKPANLSRTAYRWKQYDIATALAAPASQDKKGRRP